jgi:hypothetical protein
MEIKARNVNHAFSEVFWLLNAYINTNAMVPEDTRNGPAYAFPSPVITTYTNPSERVLFHNGRDANPIFHLMESIWMLAGRQDVEFLQLFNSKIGQFSDDQRIFNAAYGYRWRHHFGHDQLLEVIDILRADPNSRQAVIQIWDHFDLVKPTKDKACNTQVIFDTRGDRLNMTVFNRSNDIWWGAYGANAVHFSVLQEFVAIATGFKMGIYRQISNNFHFYTELYNATQYIYSPPNVADFDYYSSGDVKPIPLFTGDYRTFLQECERFCDHPFEYNEDYEHEFFKQVALPMAMVSYMRRNKLGDGRNYATLIHASDWRVATLDWINRREEAKQRLPFCKK